MNRRKTLLTVAIMAVCAAAALPGLDFDFGGSLDNRSTPSIAPAAGAESFAMDQRDKLALWAEMHFGQQISVSAEGSYTFTLLVPLCIDLDFLTLDWEVLPSLRARLGRMTFTDFTGHVLNHTLDGGMFTLDLPLGTFSAGAGYSGLILKPSSLIVMSRADGADLSDSGVFLGPPRLIGKAEALFPIGQTRQDLTLSVVLQQDLRAGSAGTLSTQYYGAGLSGTLLPSLYYGSFLFVSTGQSSSTGPILAFLGGLGVKYFREELLSSRFELRAVFSSGDADSTSYLEGNTASSSGLFVPISQETLGIAFTPQLGNLVLIDARYSLKPLAGAGGIGKKLQLEAGAAAYLRPTSGASFAAGLDTASTEAYLGTEARLAANFRPFSDLGASLTLAAFLPNPGAFSGSFAQARIAGQLEVSFSF